MPLYEYFCQACGKNLEKLQPMKERDLVSCPDCGARADRQMSLFSYKFYNPFTKDGEGFTSTAYRPEEYKERVKHNLGKDDTL